MFFSVSPPNSQTSTDGDEGTTQEIETKNETSGIDLSFASPEFNVSAEECGSNLNCLVKTQYAAVIGVVVGVVVAAVACCSLCIFCLLFIPSLLLCKAKKEKKRLAK